MRHQKIVFLGLFLLWPVAGAARQAATVLCIISDKAPFSADADYFRYAFGYINTNLSSLFPEVQFNYQQIVTDGDKLGSAAKALFDGYLSPPNKALLLGPAFSQQAQIVADIAQFYYLPQIGYSNTMPELSVKSQYPYFVRLPTSPSQFVQPAIELLLRYRWSRFALLTTDSETVYHTSQELETALQRRNLTNYRKAIYGRDATEVIASSLRNNYRVFVVVRDASDELPDKRLECIIYSLGAYGMKYFWIQLGFPDSATASSQDSCTDSERARSLEGAVEFDTPVMEPGLPEARVGIAGKTLGQLYADFLASRPAGASATSIKSVSGFDLRFDAAMAAALALNSSLQTEAFQASPQLANSSFKARLFHSLLSLDFLGLSGPVRFDRRGDRLSQIRFYQLKNLKRNLVATFDPTEGNVTWLEDLWFIGGQPPLDTPEVIIEDIRLSLPATTAIASISSLGMALSVAAVAVNFHYRKLRLIKMSSPLVNNVIGAGCLMCYASCIVMAANSHWSVSTALCWAQTALLTLGYSAAFGAMLAKTWWVHRIFANLKLRKAPVQSRYLLLFIVVVVVADIVLLALWAGLDPLALQASEYLIEERSDGSTLSARILLCASRNQAIWLGAEFGKKGILLFAAIIFAWETRTVQLDTVNDSKKIGVCVYNTTVLALIGVVVAFVLPDSSYELRLILVAICTCGCATITLALVFGTKVHAIWRLGPNRIDAQEALETVDGQTSNANTAGSTSAADTR